MTARQAAVTPSLLGMMPPPVATTRSDPILSSPQSSFARGSIRSLDESTRGLHTGTHARGQRAHLHGNEGSDAAQHPEVITRALYGPEPGWIRVWIIEKHDAYLRASESGCCSALCFLLAFELKLTVLSMLVGPFLTWRAALTLARESLLGGQDSDLGGVDAKLLEEHRLYNRVITFVEGLFEAGLQIILQARVFYKTRGTIDAIDPRVFTASIFVSACALLKSTYEFCRQFHDIQRALGLPPSVLESKAFNELDSAAMSDLTVAPARAELRLAIDHAAGRMLDGRRVLSDRSVATRLADARRELSLAEATADTTSALRSVIHRVRFLQLGTYEREMPPILQELRQHIEAGRQHGVHMELMGEAEGLLKVAESVTNDLQQARVQWDSERAGHRLEQEQLALEREQEQLAVQAEDEVRRLETWLAEAQQSARGEGEEGEQVPAESDPSVQAEVPNYANQLALARLRALRLRRHAIRCAIKDERAVTPTGEDIEATRSALASAELALARHVPCDDDLQEELREEIDQAKKWVTEAVKQHLQNKTTAMAVRLKQHQTTRIASLVTAGEVADNVAVNHDTGLVAITGSIGDAQSVTLMMPWPSSTAFESRIFRPPGSSEVLCVAVSSDHVAMGLFSGEICVYDNHNPALASSPTQLDGHAGMVLGLALEGDLLVSSARHEMTVWQWSIAHGCSIAPPKQGHQGEVVSVCITSACIVSGSADCTARVWRSDDSHNDALHILKHREDVNSVRAEGDVIVTACSDMCVHVWSLASGKRTHRLEGGHTRPIWSVVLHKGVLASGADGADSVVCVWSLSADGRYQSHRLRSPGSDGVLGLAANGEGSVTALFGDGTVRVWWVQERSGQ